MPVLIYITVFYDVNKTTRINCNKLEVLLQILKRLVIISKMAITFGKGYCDLNIPIDIGSEPKEKLDIVRRALTLGYQTIALNITIDQKDLTFKGKSGKKRNKDECKGLLDFPEPPVLRLEESDYPGAYTTVM
jgi:hypothetical protein